MGRFTHKTGAALLAALCMAGAQSASAQLYMPGPWLPVTNITAQPQGDPVAVTLEWDDFSDLQGVQIYASPTLEPGLADWQPLGQDKTGLDPLDGTDDVYPLSTVRAFISQNAGQHFYRLRAVRTGWGGAGDYMCINLETREVTTYAATDPVVVAMTNNITIADVTTNLWLRWINPGSFTMGAPTNEYNRFADREEQHKVTLTKGFWTGVFQVTQRQYEMIMNGFPSSYTVYGSIYKAGWKPMFVSYDTLRGGTSSTATNTVQSGTFLHGLSQLVRQAGKDIEFDLPTDAQWEYACRAGTTGTYNDSNVIETSDIPGGAAFARLDKLGRYFNNQSDNAGGASGTPFYSTDMTRPGCYKPNAAGLYDMHGNMYEWCLDVYFAGFTGLAEDPVVTTDGDSSSLRVLRGGNWNYSAWASRSAFRSYSAPSVGGTIIGFRVFGAPVP